MLPWAVALSCGVALVRRDKAPRVVLAVLVAKARRSRVCAMVRAVAFGRVAPLAVYAKPSDLSHGLVYVAGALLATAVPVLLVARPTTPLAAVVTAAFGMHVLAVIAAGGDSMPYARLFVPLVPTVLLVHLDPARPQALWVSWVRSARGVRSRESTSSSWRGRGAGT